ncbi:acyltransferase family protein [Bacteroides faecichinchillae]
MKQVKDYRISNLRVFAILTVVLGHSIILYSSSWHLMPTHVSVPLLDTLKNIINTYQMELYFFISGWCCYSSIIKSKNYQSFLQSKIKRLIIPYLLFGLLWMLPIKLALNIPAYQNVSLVKIYLDYFLGFNNGHLWFLYALFLIFVISWIINRMFIKLKWGGYLCLAFTFLMQILSNIAYISIFNISAGMKYAFWFQAGLCIRQYGNKAIVPILMCVIGSACFINAITPIISLLIVIGLYFIVPNTHTRITDSLDKNSFGVYLFHSPLIYITYHYFGNASPWLVVCINLFLWGSLSYILTDIIQRSKIKIL